MARLSPISRDLVAEQHQSAFDEVSAPPDGCWVRPHIHNEKQS